MRSKRNISRRNLLRGAGTVAIGLPLLPELLSRPARADEDSEIPCRVFTMSFGLGIEESLQNERFSGPLETLAPFAAKAAFFTNVDGGPLAANGTPHFSTSASLFTGVPQDGANNYHAGGPSMEQVAKNALHPDGVPNVSVTDISAGLWARTGAVSQYTRRWNNDGSPAGRPERRPSRIFDLLFGSRTPGSGDGGSEDLVRRHLHRSVLDTVMDQYQSLVSARSPLGVDSKARVHNHLAAIRDVETRLIPVEDSLFTCDTPAEPTDPSDYSFYDAASGSTGAGAPSIDWKTAEDAMALIGELIGLGIGCDAVRFGSLIMVGGGGHVRFMGEYEALGETMDFTDYFSSGTPHDRIFHSYNKSAIRIYQHFVIKQLTHLLRTLDGIEEANGLTALDNTLILVGTEYGENHDSENCFHAILGGGDRFNAGWYDQALIPSDVYHQALAAYDIDSGIPSRWRDYEPTEISGLRS